MFSDRVSYVANTVDTVVASKDDGSVPGGVGADGADGFGVQRGEVEGIRIRVLLRI